MKERGIAHIFLIILLLIGLAVGVYLVQQKTNILPKALESGQQEVPEKPSGLSAVCDPNTNELVFEWEAGSRKASQWYVRYRKKEGNWWPETEDEKQQSKTNSNHVRIKIEPGKLPPVWGVYACNEAGCSDFVASEANSIAPCLPAVAPVPTVPTPTPTPDFGPPIPIPTQEYKIPLKLGWNLISVPWYPVDDKVGAVMGGLVDKVYYYNNGAGKWESAQTIEPGKGYWAAAVKDGDLTVKLKARDYQPLPAIELKDIGWHFIGYVSNDLTPSTSIGGYFANITGKWESMFRYRWDVGFEIARPGSGFTSMDIGRGYWINMKESGTILP